ncbi:hypothetical protein BDW02DRAFT_255621 [Decorospora gaudefroyi]|uniref:Metalloendopeptidase n=1 Tax=Decorospora gaudefroyi TaxID=184978 RepID=A0A6A5KDP5_9PLEO|nr:hypothetical protein BDW02DRAFT_255621 [Decorospora gaudefroyi]
MLFFHALIALLLATLTLSCPPPYNDMRFIGNTTHTSYDLIQAVHLNPDFGWNELVIPTGAVNQGELWPCGDSGVAVVSMCFRDAKADAELADFVFDSVNMWLDKLNFPSSDRGHAVKFRVHIKPDGSGPEMCYDETGHWNPINDSNAVIIRSDRGLPYKAAATVGYRKTDARRHHNEMYLNPEKLEEGDKVTVAHEWGHVLGLSHEHRRDDRDDWLDYKCENVVGYEEARRRVEDAGVHGIDEVCESAELWYRLGFVGYAFTKNLWGNDEKAEKVTRKGPFDGNSIMLYHSYQGVGKDKDYNKYTDVPLVKWRNPGHKTHPKGRTADNCFKYRPLEDVSDGDFDAIKDLYPWTG